jgi:hypothetical protein
MFDVAHDTQVRAAAFQWLSDAVALHGDVLPRSLLAQGFMFRGMRVPLLGPTGIFKPRAVSLERDGGFDRAELNTIANVRGPDIGSQYLELSAIYT